MPEGKAAIGRVERTHADGALPTFTGPNVRASARGRGHGGGWPRTVGKRIREVQQPGSKTWAGDMGGFACPPSSARPETTKLDGKLCAESANHNPANQRNSVQPPPRRVQRTGNTARRLASIGRTGGARRAGILHRLELIYDLLLLCLGLLLRGGRQGAGRCCDPGHFRAATAQRTGRQQRCDGQESAVCAGGWGRLHGV